jgi:hypothetical protein
MIYWPAKYDHFEIPKYDFIFARMNVKTLIKHNIN